MKDVEVAVKDVIDASKNFDPEVVDDESEQTKFIVALAVSLIVIGLVLICCTFYCICSKM